MDSRPALHTHKPWLPLLVTLALMTGLGGWVGWQWQAQEARSRSEAEQRFSNSVADIERTLRERMRAYEMVLRGLAGLVAGADEVRQEDWLRAADQLQLQDFYPGIQALALSRYARGEALPSLIEAIQRSGRQGFRMYPRGDRDEYVIVDYVYPPDWRNRRVLGFDMFSEATRREAIVEARESGNPVLTAPLRLKQETESSVQIGVLLFMPVYRINEPVTTEEERRRAFAGTLYGAFRLTDLMEGILGSRSQLFQLQLFDAADPDVALLTGRAPVSTDASFERTRSLYMYGRSWQLQVASTPEYEAMTHDNRLTFSLLAAMSAAVLFSLLVGGYLYLRERTLRSSQTLSLHLQEREARFRQLIEQLPVATLLCNAKGRIELANQSAASLLGSAEEPLAGERVSRYLPGVLEESPGQRLREANQQEAQALREDGVPIPVSISLTSFRRGDGLHHIINLVDLQPRKRDEERFRNVVEASPNAFVLVDRDGQIVMVNRQTELLFGYSRQELLGQPVELLLPESLRELHRGLRQGYIEHPEPLRIGGNRELFGLHRDGRSVPIEIGLSPLRSADELLVQAVIIDIGHRRAAERRLRDQADQLELANRYKSEFLANMSHELRTPLNSILILSDQLRQNAAGNLSDKQVRHADILHRAGHDLLQLINDVLDLAKIEAGRMQFKLEALDLRELLETVEAELGGMAAEKGLTFTTCIELGVPASVNADRQRLQQILRNLLTNALKFTEQGSVELLVRCKAPTAQEDQETLQILVRDSGIGIAEDQHERIFQAFQQIDGSISRHYGGTGLGLVITQQLVEALGGHILLQSAPGEGSCFTVELPLTPASAAEAWPVRLMPQRGGPGPGLLIIENDADFASVIAEVGQSHGFPTRICRNGEEALAALECQRFAAVTLDILLPDISGWQVYRQLRADARHQGMPVIIISSAPQPDDWHDNGSRYLLKPVAQSELERLFIELARHGHNPMRLLLLELDQQRRRQARDYFERRGYSVTAASRSEDARLAFAEQHYSALVIDYDLPNETGLDLLDALERLRSLDGVTVVVSSREPLSEEDRLRLQRYSAVALSRHEGLERMAEALRPEPAGVAAALRDFEHPLLGRRVLLVDGDVRTIYLLTALLDELGLQTVPATNDSEALQRFDESAFDLVLLDMSMPSAAEDSLARKLKEEQGCQVPIIGLTANATQTDRERCLAAGADDQLAKPVERQALVELLRRWLGSANSPQGR